MTVVDQKNHLIWSSSKLLYCPCLTLKDYFLHFKILKFMTMHWWWTELLLPVVTEALFLSVFRILHSILGTCMIVTWLHQQSYVHVKDADTFFCPKCFSNINFITETTRRLKYEGLCLLRGIVCEKTMTAFASNCMCLYTNMLIFTCIKKSMLFGPWLVLKQQAEPALVFQTSVFIPKYLRIAAGLI